MDIERMVGRQGDDGPTTVQAIAYLHGLDVDDESVAVLACVVVQVARTLDRCVVTGASPSVVPNMAKQLRETLTAIREVMSTKLEADDTTPDPFAAVVAEMTASTPSLFVAGPPA